MILYFLRNLENSQIFYTNGALFCEKFWENLYLFFMRRTFYICENSHIF